MKTYTLKVFQKSDRRSDLRLVDLEGTLVAQRELDRDGVGRFVAEVDARYRRASPNLAELGQRLYAWVDGPTDRWLETLLAKEPALALRIDVDERLRHLPWELMQREGTFLCVNPLRPFTPIRHVEGHAQSYETANRPLRVLFMASSPKDVLPVLDFEDEERKILDATRKGSIELVVEESGSLNGLQQRLEEVGRGHFDIAHITGHAAVVDGTPRFLLESDTGYRKDATRDDIVPVLQHRWPKLLFLSGCETGQAAAQGSVASLAEALVQAGAPVVLGWALPVGDRDASVAAAKLYEALSLGKGVDEAVIAARQALFDAKSPYWHLLRVYAADPALRLPHVTPQKHPGRARLHVRPARNELLDAGGKVEVCSREAFVGRRRAIQRCLRVLRSREGDEAFAEGVLLQGMGGLGKSSLAARLCERMPDHARLVWCGRVDETELLRVMADRLRSGEVNQLLNDPKLGLQQRLENVLAGPLSSKPALFIFDDFEHNLSPAGEAHIVQPGALGVLGALLAAIRQTASESRVIVTSRYDFPLRGPARLALESLDALRGADLEKKASRLPAMTVTDKMEEADRALRRRALVLSAGNPRLMEWLDKVLAEKGMDHAALFDALEAKADEFREDLLLRALLDRLAPDGRRLVARIAVYGLPIERAGIEAVAGGIALEPHIERAAGLGLVEVGPSQGDAEHYHVSPLLRPLLQGELSAGDQSEVLLHAVGYAYESRWKGKERFNEAWGLEIHRLAMEAKQKAVAVEVGDAIATNWVYVARYREALALCEATLRLGDDYRILHEMARAEMVLGETDQALAHYETALAACPVDESSPNAVLREHSGILYNLAELVAQQGDVARALELGNQSLLLQEKIGDVQGKSATLNSMAGVIAQQGDVARALELWNQSLLLKEKIGNVQGKAATLHNMAGVLAQQGDVARALELWNQSLLLQEKIGDVRGKAATLHNMAGVLAQQGDVARALELWNQSLLLQEKIGDVQGKAATLHNMAGVLAQQGDVARALELWNQALLLKEKIGDVQGKAATLHNIAGVIAQQGDVARALELWNQALLLEEKIGNVQGKAATLANMAWAAGQSGDQETKRRLNEDAARLLGNVRAWLDLATVLANLGASDAADAQAFLAQAVWLAFTTQVPLEDTVAMTGMLIAKLTPAHASALSLAAPLQLLIALRGEGHPKREQLVRHSAGMLGACWQARGLAPEAFEAFVEQEGLGDPARVLPAALRALESLVPEDAWLFDRTLVLSRHD